MFSLNVGIGNAKTISGNEIQEVLKKHPAKEISIQENDQKTENTEKTAKFEAVGDTITDPYDQIRTLVSLEDTIYFNQLKAHIEKQDSMEQTKYKAVVYAILQDTALKPEQKKILALSQFEILARIPGSDYRFSKKSGERLTSHPNDQVYKEKVQRYYAYVTYLGNLMLDQEIAKINEINQKKQEDIKNKQEI